MAQRPAEVPPALAPDPEQPSTSVQRTSSPRNTAEPGVDVPAGAAALPEDSPQPHKKSWKRILLRFSPLLAITSALYVVVWLSDFLDIHYATNQLSPNENGIAILGEVTQFDWLDTRRLSVTWSLLGLGEYKLRDSDDRVPPDRAVDVYLDDASTPTFSYDPTRLPMTETGKRLLPQGLVSFGMEHRTTTGKQYFAPFDGYRLTAFAFIIERATNKSLPIAVFAVGDAGPADFTTTSVDTPTRNNFTYDTEDGPATVEVESHTISAKVRHSLRSRTLTFSMFAINWVLTLCSVAIALVVLRRRGEVKDGIAFLPITVILSVPTIRGLYVGSPPFGILLDVWGFFPQMATALLCAMIVLYVFATQSTRDKGVTVERKEV